MQCMDCFPFSYLLRGMPLGFSVLTDTGSFGALSRTGAGLSHQWRISRCRSFIGNSICEGFYFGCKTPSHRGVFSQRFFPSPWKINSISLYPMSSLSPHRWHKLIGDIVACTKCTSLSPTFFKINIRIHFELIKHCSVIQKQTQNFLVA